MANLIQKIVARAFRREWLRYVTVFAGGVATTVAFLNSGFDLASKARSVLNPPRLALATVYFSKDSIRIDARALTPEFRDIVLVDRQGSPISQLSTKAIYTKIHVLNESGGAASFRNLRLCVDAGDTCGGFMATYVDSKTYNPEQLTNTVINVKEVKQDFLFAAFLGAEMRRYAGRDVYLAWEEADGSTRRSKVERLPQQQNGLVTYY